MSKKINPEMKFDSLFQKIGHKEFCIGLIIFEKKISRKKAEEVYKKYMDNDSITTLLDINQIIEGEL